MGANKKKAPFPGPLAYLAKARILKESGKQQGYYKSKRKGPGFQLRALGAIMRARSLQCISPLLLGATNLNYSFKRVYVQEAEFPLMVIERETKAELLVGL